MGLLSSFKSFLKKEPDRRENKRMKSKETDNVSASDSKNDEKVVPTGSRGKSENSNHETVSARNSSNVSIQELEKDQEKLHRIDEREILWEMNKKIDELLEIKELYDDMLDWMVELSKKEEVEESRESSRGTSKESNLSPRLRQVLEIVREKGELNASDLSEELDLSQNRCSELLNSLFRANYLSKKRVGRKVYYRVKSSDIDIGV